MASASSKVIGVLIAGMSLALTISGVFAQDASKLLKVGDKAPAFTSTDDQGKPWKSSDHVGKKIVVLYFYPADLTGGCTKQACGYRDDIEKLVTDAVARDARVLCGGAAPDRPGFYYPPTVLTGITPDMRVHDEEVFGPVATLYRVPDIDAAIELANGTRFGLGANAWTTDQEEQGRLIRDLAAGMVFINGNVTSYPQLPFGGVKSSGHGRELSVQGIREFCNIKTVWIGENSS